MWSREWDYLGRLFAAQHRPGRTYETSDMTAKGRSRKGALIGTQITESAMRVSPY
jgi:hypothetical protein